MPEVESNSDQYRGQASGLALAALRLHGSITLSHLLLIVWHFRPRIRSSTSGLLVSAPLSGGAKLVFSTIIYSNSQQGLPF